MRRKKNNGRFEISEPEVTKIERTGEEEKAISTFVMPSPYPEICGMIDATEEYEKGIELSGSGICPMSGNTQRMIYHNSLNGALPMQKLYESLDVPKAVKNRMVGDFIQTQMSNAKNALQEEYARSVFNLDINFVQHIPEMIMNALDCLVLNNIMAQSEAEYIMSIVQEDVHSLSQKMLLEFNQLGYMYPSIHRGLRLNIYDPSLWSEKQNQNIIEAERIHNTFMNIITDPIMKVNYVYGIVYSILSHALTSTDAAFEEHEQHRMLPMLLGYIDGCGHFITYAESLIDMNRIFTMKSYNIQDFGEYKMMDHTVRRLFSRVDDDEYYDDEYDL